MSTEGAFEEAEGRVGVVDISLGVETGEGGSIPLPVSPSPVAIANGNPCMDMLITNRLPYVRAPPHSGPPLHSAHFFRTAANASSWK